MKIEEIGQAISDRRKELCVSQAQLADICGISVHTLSNIEGGASNPTVGSLLKIVDALGLKIEVSVAKTC